MKVNKIMKIGPKGQVVIPKIMRSALGLQPGSKVIVDMEGDKVVIEKDNCPDFENMSKEELERLMKEYYEKYADLEHEITEDFKHVDMENWPEWEE